MATSTKTIAIVGGGASGILAAVHLARIDAKPRRILLFDPAPELAGGAAFSTEDPQHLLNAPARVMSAFDNDSEHFVRWLGSRGASYGSGDFVPRRLYRLYLQDLLSQTQRELSGGSTISWVRERVVDIQPWDDVDGRTLVLRTGTGQVYTGRFAILAIGAPDPSVLNSFGVSGPLVVNNPWSPQALEDLPLDNDAFIVGTGLTTVDVVLALASGCRSRIHARSRHGVLPTVHQEDGFVAWPELELSGASSALEVVRRLRWSLLNAEAAGWGWRNVVSAARDALPLVWEQLPDEEKVRFLRHAGRLWEVHRHRMSPQISHAFNDVLRSGRLTIGTGNVVDIEERPGHVRPRFVVTLDGRRGRERLEVGLLIDCSGPSNVAPNRIPLLCRLMSQGLAAVDSTGRGLAVNEAGAVLGTAQRGQGLLYSIGWVRSGRCFESTAVPALRKQAAGLAEHLSALTWNGEDEPGGPCRSVRPGLMSARSVA